MTDDRLELTRRKILAGAGAVGLAGAGAGLGTSAFFSDQETFVNNRLVAGSLDLKVDWEEHYSDWSIDENDDRTDDSGGDESDSDTDGDGVDDFEVRMEEPEVSGEFTPFPPGTSSAEDTPDPLVWVPDEFVDDFMDNTSIEGYPDPDNDGITEFPIEEMDGRRPCDFLADVGADDDGLDPDSDPLGRTDNEDTRLDDGSPAPMINLTDVKPGDFGEITFSTHLCDNPGYLWMNMPGGLDLDENGHTEPESKDPDEEEGVVELADAIQTSIWYDNNCDNLITREEPLDVMVVVDTSRSMSSSDMDVVRQAANAFITKITDEVEDPEERLRGGLLTYNGRSDAGSLPPSVFDRPVLRTPGLIPPSGFDTDGDGSPNAGDFLPSDGVGDTPTPHALDLGRQVLNARGRPEARQVIILTTDGLPDYNEETGAGDLTYTVTDSSTGDTWTSGPYPGDSDGETCQIELDATLSVANDDPGGVKADGIDIIVSGIDVGNADCFGTEPVTIGDNFLSTVAGLEPVDSLSPGQYFPTNLGNLDENAEDIALQLAGGDGSGDGTGDEIIFTGSLREAEAVLTGNEGRGLPLDADRSTAYDELGDPEADDDRECFTHSNTQCFGLSWWLPVDHANEIQTDSATFDIGFYTEQCRHNDGSGVST